MKKKKIFREICLVVLSSMFLSLFSACNSENSVPQSTDELVLYFSYTNSDTMSRAVSLFSSLYPDVEVTVKDYSDFEQYEEYLTTLQTELSAGAGPDLILYQDGEVPDIYKMCESGALSDVNVFMEDDADFDLSTYNQNVLDVGVYKDCRYFVPLSYAVNNLVTTQETLDHWGVALTEDSPFDEITAELAKFCQNNIDNDAANLEPFGSDKLALLFPWSGVELVDYETRSVTVDTEEFRELMDFYKQLYPMEWERISDKDSSHYTEAVTPEDFQNYRYLLLPQNHLTSCLPWYFELAPTSTPISLHLGVNERVAKPTSYAIINNGGQNKNNAYLFLKVLLGHEMQTADTVLIDVPILEDAVEPRIEAFLTGSGVTTEDWNSTVTEKPLSKLVDELTNATVSEGYSPTMLEFIWNTWNPTSKAKKTMTAA